jgi:RNA polymerase sigma factor (sigma-70 family)
VPDRVLLNRARSGDQDAVADLYRRHVGAALKYARAISPSAADAEDLVAESFTRVITQLALEKGPDSSFRAYLFTTMRHRLYSQNRHEYTVEDMTILDVPVTDRDPDGHTDQELLKVAFDTLTSHEQEVLLLLDVQELRPSEVGERLGLRPSALSMRATRARAALAEAYLVAHLRPAQDAACESVRQNLGRHVRGTLSASRARHVAEHVDTCDRCRESLLELTDVNRALRAIPIFGGAVAAPRGIRSITRRLHSVPHLHGGIGPFAVKAALVLATLGVGTSAAIVLAAARTGDHPELQPIAAVALSPRTAVSAGAALHATPATTSSSKAPNTATTWPTATTTNPAAAVPAATRATPDTASAARTPPVANATRAPATSTDPVLNSRTPTSPVPTSPTPTGSATTSAPAPSSSPPGSATPTPTPTPSGPATTDPGTPTPTNANPCDPWFPGCWLIVWIG